MLHILVSSFVSRIYVTSSPFPVVFSSFSAISAVKDCRFKVNTFAFTPEHTELI